MRHIKKFELSYGSYFGTKEELTWHNGQLVYQCGDVVPDKELIIHTDELLWKDFFSAVQGVVAGWKRYYNGMVCDGLLWSVEIETDTLKVCSAGNHHFPEHYDTFLQHIHSILRCRKFAEDHSQSDYLVTGMTPHLINRKIRYLLRRKRLTLQKLADCLEYQKDFVRIQLNAKNTFELKDLRKIAWLLDHPFMELIDESELSIPSRSKKEILVFPAIWPTGIEDPVTNFKKHLPDLLNIDLTRMS